MPHLIELHVRDPMACPPQKCTTYDTNARGMGVVMHTTMWFIWTTRCCKVFGNITIHPVESVRNVWMQMVHTLKGRYDEIKGETDAGVATIRIYCLLEERPFSHTT